MSALPFGDRVLLAWANDWGEAYNIYLQMFSLDLTPLGDVTQIMLPQPTFWRLGFDSVATGSSVGLYRALGRTRSPGVVRNAHVPLRLANPNTRFDV